MVGAALIAVIFGSSVILNSLVDKTVIDNVILNIATVLVSYILYAFYFNLLGQYTYAVIKQKEGVEPETLPKEPKNDNAAIIIAIAICVFLLMSVLGVVAALTIPSLVNRNNDIAAKVRIKKAISSYEMAAAAYMAENSTDKNPVTNLTKFAGENCENLEEYFKIVNKYDKCAFTTTDGVYWLFDPEDGSVNVSDSYESPKYNITLGICKNGEINCKEEFPDAAEMLRK